jgi:hypothetical protein
MMTRTLRAGAYILEWTRALFTGRSDEPCLGAVCLAPNDSKAGPGAPPTRGLVHFSPLARGWCCAPLAARMTKDWRRRGPALASAPCGALDVDALDGRLCMESESRRSEPSKRWWGLVLQRPPRRVVPARRVPPDLGGARAARNHVGAGHPLVFSNRANCQPRA